MIIVLVFAAVLNKLSFASEHCIHCSVKNNTAYYYNHKNIYYSNGTANSLFTTNI